MDANVCQAVAASGWMKLGDLCEFGYDFQTFFAGAAALAAAWYAATPVWKQLTDSNLQTMIMHREALAARLSESQDRSTRVKDELDRLLLPALRATKGHEGEPINIDPHDAHGLEQQFYGALDWYLGPLSGMEEVQIETAKRQLFLALLDFRIALSDAHWPEWNDQSGEDYAYSDEEWAEVQKKASEAASGASHKVDAVVDAMDALIDAHRKFSSDLRLQIASLDKAIAKSR